MILKIFKTLLFFIAILATSSAKGAVVDSLYQNIKNANGENKILAYIPYLDYEKNLNIDNFTNGIQAFQELINNNHKQVYVFKLIKYKAALMLVNERPSTVIVYIDSIIHRFGLQNEDLQTIQYLKSTCLIKQGDLKGAIENCFKIKEYAKKDNNAFLNKRADANLGWAQMELGNLKEAIRYFNIVLDDAKESRDFLILGATYSNLVACYGALNKIDTAQYYLEKGLAIVNKYGMQFTKGLLLSMQTNVYEITGKRNKIPKLHEEILELRKQNGDVFYYVSDLAEIANYYARVNENQKGLSYAYTALHLTDSLNMILKKPLVYKAILMCYENLNDFKNANRINNILAKVMDTIHQTNTEDAVATLKVKYETAEKERVISAQALKIRNKDLIIIPLISLATLIIISLYYFNKVNAQKKKVEFQQQISTQKMQATAAIIEAEEKERQRIGADLHDGIGQILTAAKFNLNAINELPLEEPHKSVLLKTEELVKQGAVEVRQVSHLMMPQTLLQAGLTYALENFINKIEHTTKMHLSITGLGNDLPNDKAIIIYRIIQEAVNNILKHAQATIAYINIINDGNEISISIEDNGQGFNTDNTSEGIGLSNIKYRVAYLNGHLEINSAKDKGTLINIIIPRNEV